MRIPNRSRFSSFAIIAFAVFTAVASVALPAPAFGQLPAGEAAVSSASPISASVDVNVDVSTAAALAEGSISVADHASPSDAPAPAPAPAPANDAPAPLVAQTADAEVISEEELTRRSKEQNVEDWFKRHFALMAHRFDTELSAWMHAAKEDLKQVLGLAPPTA